MFTCIVLIVVFTVMYLENLIDSNIKRINEKNYTLSDKYNNDKFRRLLYILIVLINLSIYLN